MKPTGSSLLRIVRRGAFALLSSALLLPLFASAPKAQAQVTFSVQIGAPPVCPYGYFEYAPYSCAPPGFYGPGYFYNGIFLGVGPWANWGYGHGWGPHRFYRSDGGYYYPGYWRHHAYLRPGHRWDHRDHDYDRRYRGGNAYGHYKDHGNGNAYGHYKDHGDGNGYGHYKNHGNNGNAYGHDKDHGNGHGHGHNR